MSFLESIREPPRNVPTPPTPPTRGAWAPTPRAAAALQAELDILAAATEGTRNATLNRAAFNLAQLVAAGEISDPHVRDALTAAAHAIGLEPTETRRTIDSGFRVGTLNPRKPPARPVEPVFPALEGTNSSPPAEEAITDWEQLWADPGTLEWLCEPLVPAGRLVALYSPPGVGKSLLALELAVAISRGSKTLGSDTTQAPVLYLDYENTMLDVRDRLQNMHYGPSDLTGLHYWSFPTLAPLDTAQGGTDLLDMANRVGAKLVIIDTVSRAVQGDENENATWLALYRNTLVHLKAQGIAVIRLDHTGKDETKGQRGGSAKSGDVDLVWRMEEVIKDHSYILECEKHRIQLDETRLNIRRSAGPLAHHVDTRAIGQIKKDAILQALDDAGLPQDAGRDVARKVLNAAGIKVRNETLAELLKARQNPYGQLEQ